MQLYHYRYIIKQCAFTHVDLALGWVSLGYILGADMNKRTLLNNVMTLQTNYCFENFIFVCCCSVNRYIIRLLLIHTVSSSVKAPIERPNCRSYEPTRWCHVDSSNAHLESDIELTTTPKHVPERNILHHFMYTMGTF